MVTPGEATSRCVHCSTTWSSVSADLAVVVNSSDLGTKMFASAWRDYTSGRVRLAIDNLLEELGD